MDVLKALTIIGVLAVGMLCAGQAWAANRTISLESLLREMLDRDRMARWPKPEYTCRQASSYDRRSKTPDDPEGWFANNDWSQFLRSEVHQGRREWVLMDADGPGCVVRIWWGGMMPPKERRIRFYLDGSDTPAIEAPAYELLAGGLLAGRPLSIENARGAPGAPGGMNLFLPIPYAKSCKITWDDVNPHDPNAPPESRWYNIEYRTYTPGTKVETFTMAALNKARGSVERVCRTLLEPPIPAGDGAVMLEKDVEPGAQESVTLPPGPAAVRLLEMKLTTGDPAQREQALRSTILRMEFDGEETVWCPVGDFSGSGVGVNPLQSWYRTVTKDGVMTCRWVMPYRESARITLMNLGGASVKAHLRALVSGWKWDDRSMHFHANWRCDNHLPTRPFSDWNYLTANGKGVYMGDTLSIFNPVAEWWGEGDEKIGVDGESFPSHFGTGSEDYYCYSYGDTHLFQGPFSSQARCDGPGNKGHTVVTRTRCLDAISFAKSLRFDMEVWHWADCKVSYAVATYWYALPGATHNRLPQHAEAIEAIPQVPPPLKIAGAVECETMEALAKSPGVVVETQSGGLSAGEWSGGAHLFVRANKVDDFIELRIPAAESGPQKVTLYATKSWDYGILRFSINGKPAGKDFDAYHKPAVASGPIALGVFEPEQGQMVLRVEVVGANPAATGTKAYFGLDCVTLTKP
jgi:hypothetical protein